MPEDCLNRGVPGFPIFHLNQKGLCPLAAFVHLPAPYQEVIKIEQEKYFPPYVRSLLASPGWSGGDSCDDMPLQCVEITCHNLHTPLGTDQHVCPLAIQTRHYPK